MLGQGMEAPAGVDYIVAPETAIDARIWEHEVSDNNYVTLVRHKRRAHYPDAEVIIGATTA